MPYDLDPLCQDCYPGTTVLINKFDIRDQRKLSEVESVLTSARSAQWLNEPMREAFDFSHYRAIHAFIFSDLYHWAGQIRSVNISKKGTAFIPAAEINKQAELIFHHLHTHDLFKGLSHTDFVDHITDFYCDTNYLHPFREGNGRVQRIFLSQLIQNAGYRIDFSCMDTDLLMIATIQSSQGVYDLLKQIFSHSIVPL